MDQLVHKMFFGGLIKEKNVTCKEQISMLKVFATFEWETTNLSNLYNFTKREGDHGSNNWMKNIFNAGSSKTGILHADQIWPGEAFYLARKLIQLFWLK